MLGGNAKVSIAISTLSIMASALYVLVVFATGVGAGVANSCKQQAWHWRSWLLLACFFMLLTASRLLDVEETLRDNLRSMLRADAAYDNRRDFQRPLVAGLVVIAAMVGFWWTFGIAGRITGRRNITVMVALISGAFMILLIAMRMISLHLIDALLYGPFKLNWVADVGLSLIVIGAAIYYIRVVLTSR